VALKEQSIMSVEAASLSRTVSAMRPMVPAKNFDVSQRFYIELGFQPRPLADRLVEMQLGAFSLDSSIRTESQLRWIWRDTSLVGISVQRFSRRHLPLT
jgi:hypothetical protein